MSFLWNALQVASAVGGHLQGDQVWEATGVSIDSRSVKSGDLFVALKGDHFDGHAFVGAALKAGAVAAVVQKIPADLSPKANLVKVDDVLAALQDLGRARRIESQAKIIAVTGSVGKTGTKEQLRTMLAACGPTYANEGSFNNHWGVPLSLARLPMEAIYGVFELGMNHAGELGPLSRFVEPHVSLITNIEKVHLEFFSSEEAIADAKAEIFLGMRANGAVVLNRDNRHFARLVAAARTQGVQQIFSFGREAGAEARLMDYTQTENGSKVVAEIFGKIYRYNLGVSGVHLAFNSVGAILAATLAGAETAQLAAQLAHYHLPKGRGSLQFLDLPQGTIKLVDETFNASPVAVQASIAVLGQMVPAKGGRRVLALGEMRELGPEASALHRALAPVIVEAGIDVVHCCGDLMRELYEALPQHMRGFYADDSQNLASLIAGEVRAGDVVMVKGSKSTKMNYVLETLAALAAQTGSVQTVATEAASVQKVVG